MSRLREVFLETSGLNLEQLSSWGEELCNQQRAVNWAIGDVARHAKHALKLGENYSQAFPPWVSPGLIQRCEAVSSAYPRESDRNPLASWTVHMTHANKPNRIELVAASVDAGRTSDEERQLAKGGDTNKPRWLLAFDVNGQVNTHWHSGSGVEAAMNVSTWIVRLVERLKEKGLTDAVMCFDAPNNHRKELTKGWDDPYKGNRGPKDPQLTQQIKLCETLLLGHGFACVSVEGMEADDILASFGKQFPGKVTIVSDDKDMRQSLSEKCNILRDVTWEQDEHSGDVLPTYHWVTAKSHMEGCTYCSAQVSGISPDQWTEFQTLAGDATDCVSGAVGIGPKIASDLLKTFGTIEAAIQAAKESDPRIKESKRLALIEFEQKLSVTRALVTLKTDLVIPSTTRL